MKVLVSGAGPAGLMFAATLGEQHDVTVIETQNPDGRPGHGITLSRQIASALRLPSVSIADNLVLLLGDEELRSHPVQPPRAGVSRRALIDHLLALCEGRGIVPEYGVPANEAIRRASSYDLVVGADGAGSAVRNHIANAVGATIGVYESKYTWLSARVIVDGIRMVGRTSDLGGFVLHIYPHEAGWSTAVVQCSNATATRLESLGAMPEQLAFVSEVFARELSQSALERRGAERWEHFREVSTTATGHGKYVLLGDALHTTHFSTGLGTTLALEDSAALSHALETSTEISAALLEYQQSRISVVKSEQRNAVYTKTALDRVLDSLDAKALERAREALLAT